ncbi:MAG TPA: dolichyl-phosphate beta-glucosyltransferase [Candidatus Saccharimonadales bacterium]|nr:dolichyl-phosphate beta-glucosyltransferase [Candidatus Saccharimonadales bacterium]
MSKKKYSLDVIMPVYNEEKDLEKKIVELYTFLKKNLNEFKWQIIIADNASKDKTELISRKLTRLYSTIKYIKLSQKGRGRALRYCWLKSKADVMCYMDLDLSTDLKYLKPLIVPLLTRGYNVSTGSRLMPGSRVINRTIKREITSRLYNVLIKIIFPGYKITDAQCGFKAITQKTAKKLLPLIEDNQWFFDTELLLAAWKLKYKIHEEPVVWTDDPGSTVKVFDTARKDIEGLLRVRFNRKFSQADSLL